MPAAWFAQDTGSIPQRAFEFASEHRAAHAIATMCRMLVSPPGVYYAWESRPPSKRSLDDAVLQAEIEAIPYRTRATYSSGVRGAARWGGADPTSV